MDLRRLMRMLRLLSLVPSVRLHNVHHLAYDLEVDQRTVRRDIQILERAGLVCFESGCVWLEPDQLRVICRMASEPC